MRKQLIKLVNGKKKEKFKKEAMKRVDKTTALIEKPIESIGSPIKIKKKGKGR